MPAIPPEGLVAVVGLAMIGFMLLLSKIFTKLWIYLLLLSPSWSISLYELAEAIMNGESIGNIMLNHATSFIFILSPIDTYLVGSESLMIYGLVLLGIWAYVILVYSAGMLGGWGLPLFPFIVWILGKGLPCTFKLLEGKVPSWLLAFYGLPLVILSSLVLALVTIFIVKPKTRKG